MELIEWLFSIPWLEVLFTFWKNKMTIGGDGSSIDNNLNNTVFMQSSNDPPLASSSGDGGGGGNGSDPSGSKKRNLSVEDDKSIVKKKSKISLAPSAGSSEVPVAGTEVGESTPTQASASHNLGDEDIAVDENWDPSAKDDTPTKPVKNEQGPRVQIEMPKMRRRLFTEMHDSLDDIERDSQSQNSNESDNKNNNNPK